MRKCSYQIPDREMECLWGKVKLNKEWERETERKEDTEIFQCWGSQGVEKNAIFTKSHNEDITLIGKVR